jgi:hypothetical protein
MNCPGSVALIGDQSSGTNQAAMKGTAAHKVIEMMIIAGETDAEVHRGATLLVHADGKEETEYYAPGVPALDPEKPRPGWFMFMCDESMVDSVQYTIDVTEKFKAQMHNPEVFAERWLDMTWLDPRFGGTADITLVEAFGWAHLIDHKNGFHIVEVDTEQLKAYAVGVAHEHPDCEGVRVTISQPNSPHVDGLDRTKEYTRDEIALFEIQMKAAADEVSKPNAYRRAGDWCEWCVAKTRCPEYDAMLLEEAQADFNEEPPDELPVNVASTEDLARKARWVPVIDAWVKQIKGDVQRELENGNSVPGWKLVRGKANRKMPDGRVEIEVYDDKEEEVVFAGEGTAEELVKQFCAQFDIPLEVAYTAPELKSPAQLEKLGPGRSKTRKFAKKFINALAIKPEGALTVAPDTDPRDEESAFADAREEFDDDGEDFSP